MNPIKLHTPQPATHLPAHEHAARRHRAAAGLPNFLSTRKPAPAPPPPPPAAKPPTSTTPTSPPPTTTPEPLIPDP